MKQLFTIDAYSVEGPTILVSIVNNQDGKTVKIKTNLFESWLNDSGRLSFCNDSYFNGMHVQDTGKITLDEYFEYNKTEEINKDIYTYLITKMLDVKRFFGMNYQIENDLSGIVERMDNEIIQEQINMAI